MIKLIIADMDGTLLDKNKKVGTDFWATESKMHESGILFAVASGRQFYNLEAVLAPIKDRTLFLAENGTYAFYKGKEIFVRPLDKAAAIHFIEIGRKIENADLIVCGKNAAYLESTNERFVTEVRKHYNRVEIVDDLTKVDDTILKFTVCDFNDIEKNSYSYFEKYKTDFKVAISGDIWLDITDFHANKGTAIVEIQKQLGITYDETVVFGDYLNDVEMMQTAKYNYAMKNAHPEIIKMAGFITEFDNDNNGVSREIEKLLKV
ncbi:HAD family hydrolase [Flavobacterium sp. 3HN19-14]|uniref:HAD family hydrolase n=1 Tax=Flavobacterium sp. 3HN19-14 TaxID=3448133 RepID=UPI003EE165BD